MGAIGMTGPFADHLSRAVGIAPAVKVDLVIAKPRHDDVFLLCSDGLSKMVKDDAIREVLAAHADPNEAVKALVERANASGGRDNITVILVVVKDPTGFAKYLLAQQRKAAAAAAETGATPPADEAAITAESPVMAGGDPKPGAAPPAVRPVEIEDGPAISVQPVAHDSALGRALSPGSSDTEIMEALEPLATESGTLRVQPPKASDSGAVRATPPRASDPGRPTDPGPSASQEVRTRPSVPPRPEPRASVPPPRPSVPEARKSVTGPAPEAGAKTPKKS